MSLKYISRKKMQEMRFHVEIEGNTCNEFEECRPRLELRFSLYCVGAKKTRATQGFCAANTRHQFDRRIRTKAVSSV